MTRVAVIGNAGGGKTTLCRRISQALHLPHYPVDRFQWQPGWVPTPPAEFHARHEAILAEPAWIIDGWGDWTAIEKRFAAADTIIFVDLPLYLHYAWALKRQFQCLFAARPDVPEGCPMLPMTWPLLKLIWRIHHQARPQLMERIRAFEAGRQVYHLRSPHALRQFAAACGAA